MSRKAAHDPTGRYRQPEGRGPNGRRFCRWCHGEVAPRRSTFCSPQCVEEFKLEVDWDHIVRLVEKRDKGICRLCGCDTAKLSRILARLHGWDAANVRESLGFNRHSALYQIDHIQPRIEGGSNALDNLRLLCVPCHKGETRALAGRRAAARKPNRKRRPALFGVEEPNG